MRLSVINPDSGATIIYSQEVSDVIRLDKEVNETRAAFYERKPGTHPHHLALALQTKTRAKTAAVNELRRKFHVVK